MVAKLVPENIVNISAYLRELCVSALRTKNNKNTTLFFRPGTRTHPKNICHSRTLQSGVQNALSGFPARLRAGWPLKTSGNDNHFFAGVLEMPSTWSVESLQPGHKSLLYSHPLRRRAQRRSHQVSPAGWCEKQREYTRLRRRSGLQ